MDAVFDDGALVGRLARVGDLVGLRPVLGAGLAVRTLGFALGANRAVFVGTKNIVVSLVPKSPDPVANTS